MAGPATGVLLACAWVTASDDPAREVLAASPYPRPARKLARVAATFLSVVAVWGVAAAVVAARVPEVPVLGLGVEALALGLLGLAIGGALRAWHDLHRPAHAGALGLVLLAFVLSAAPRWYALHQEQTWGPPWEAAQLRWWGLLLVAAWCSRSPCTTRCTGPRPEPDPWLWSRLRGPDGPQLEGPWWSTVETWTTDP